MHPERLLVRVSAYLASSETLAAVYGAIVGLCAFAYYLRLASPPKKRAPVAAAAAKKRA